MTRSLKTKHLKNIIDKFLKLISFKISSDERKNNFLFYSIELISSRRFCET
jgi:hypothetical protein